MPIKNRFIIKIDSVLYTLTTYLDVRSNILDEALEKQIQLMR